MSRKYFKEVSDRSSKMSKGNVIEKGEEKNQKTGEGSKKE